MRPSFNKPKRPAIDGVPPIGGAEPPMPEEEEEELPTIPARGGLFDEPEGSVDIEITELPEGGLVKTYVSADGKKAVNLLTAEESDSGVSRIGSEELKGYAQSLFDGDIDDRGLVVGEIYEGEDAETDAKVAAADLNEQFDPGEDAEDEVLMAAVSEIKSGADAEPDMGFGGSDEYKANNRRMGEELDADEPALAQLNSAIGK